MASIVKRREVLRDALLAPLPLVFTLRGLVAQQSVFDFVLILVGAPGSGKSTLAKKLGKRYDVKEVSIPLLVTQSYGKKKLKKKDLMAASRESGELLGDTELNTLLRQRISKGDLRPGFILDGYPKTAQQSEYLGSLLNEFGYTGIRVVDLQIDDASARKRMQSRNRADDDPATIERRLAEYHADIQLLRERFLNRFPMFEVDASQSEEQVFLQTRKKLSLP